MKYDKYGDPIIETSEKLSGKKKKAIAIMIILQGILIAFNISVLLIEFLNLYLCFLTAPLFIFFYIAYQKGCSAIKESGKLPGYCKLVAIISPILYVATAVLAVFGG
ncbi:MAG: hypothetical protein IKT68_00320 [Clostridia bacterium]|nr:hypothetical protein [Clostridia bacterium]